MNTKDNKRRRETLHNIERVFLEFLQTRPIARITVSDLCKAAQINRSTFYANFADVYDLADRIRDRLDALICMMYAEKRDDKDPVLSLFRHIYDNRSLYGTYLKLAYDGARQITLYERALGAADAADPLFAYRAAFLKSGLNAVVQKWLFGGCAESPADMARLLNDAYRK